MGMASRLACADSSFPRLSRALALAVIRDLGISAVDVCVFAGSRHTTPESVLANPAGAAEALRHELAANELVVSDVFAILAEDFESLAVNHPDRQVREDSLRRFRPLLDFAARLEAPGVTVLPGVPFPGVDRQASLELAAAELERRAALAGEMGLRLSFEPHYRSIVPTPASVLELLGHAPNVSISLDYSHFVFQGILQRDVDPLIPRSRHLHMRQAAPEVMQARATEGIIDFAAMLRALDAAGYEGYLAIEYQCEEWLECRRVDCISETADMRDLIVAERGSARSDGDNRRG
jgi:sugar phosphate isomerase/epimerase